MTSISGSTWQRETRENKFHCRHCDNGVPNVSLTGCQSPVGSDYTAHVPIRASSFVRYLVRKFARRHAEGTIAR
jgi:hypothetical protein